MTTQHTAIPSESQVNVNQLVGGPEGYAPLGHNKLDARTKRKLTIIAVVAIVIIITVAIVASAVDYNRNNSNNTWSGICVDCARDLDIYSEGKVDYVCGTRYDCERPQNISYPASCLTQLNENSWETSCGYLCLTRTPAGYDLANAFYVYTLQQCYCYTFSQRYEKNINYCRDITGEAEMFSVGADGRPYFLNLTTMTQLRADIMEIDCADYNFYPDEEWIDLLEHHHSNISTEALSEWIHRGLSEHASIASFAKNTLELMSIGAPLWMIGLSNKASSDEIRHTQIAFDVLNMHMNGEKCLKPNAFPVHNIEIDGDWNKIAKDIAVGGCIGETVSALSISDDFSCGDNILNKYMNEIAMDEVRHSALAWVTVKWIIDIHPQDVVVSSREWWSSELIGAQSRKANQIYIYNNVIPSIVDKLWMNIDGISGYEAFYTMIIRELEIYLRQIQDNEQQCSL